MSRTFASRLAGDINTVILSITQHLLLLTMSPLEPGNKPAAKRLHLLATVLLSGPCESLCDSNLGQEAAGAWPPPSILQQPFCLALRGQRKCSNCQLRAWWQAKGPSPQDGKVNKRRIILTPSLSFTLLCQRTAPSFIIPSVTKQLGRVPPPQTLWVPGNSSVTWL